MLSTHTAYPGLNPYTSLYNPEGMEKGKNPTPGNFLRLRLRALIPFKNYKKVFENAYHNLNTY